MLALGAVNPDGCSVVNHDGICRDLAGGGAGGHRYISRVEAGHVGLNVANRLAGVVEGRLCHRVVASHELELHHIAHARLDVVGRVHQRVVSCANRNNLDLLCCVRVKQC